MPAKRQSSKQKLTQKTILTNFLLTCPESDLASFELARLCAATNLRGELHGILDRLIDEMAQAGLASWFRFHDRGEIRRILEADVDPVAWAKEQIRDKGRSEEELISIPSLNPGQAHRTASLTYQSRNIAAGKCRYCPKPLDRNSVDMCADHLRKARERKREKSKKLNKPPHGRAPGTLKALAEANKRRALKKKEEEKKG